MASNNTSDLPNSLNLPPHLSAQKYFYVGTLTVLAWDTLVLAPRSYRLGRTKSWHALKVLYYFLQILVLTDFVVTGAMFFSTSVKQLPDCLRFWPYEPICTAILLFAASTVHVIRVSAIYAHDTRVRSLLLVLLFVQAIVTAVCCSFYRSVHLLDGQGCIAGPLNNQSWVGLYWLAPTILYTTTFVLVLKRSLQSLEARPLTYWQLTLRNNLNLYGTIFLVNLANVLFYFIMTPTDYRDPIKTIVTSMAGVITATMSMRIVLGVKGSLENGGCFTPSVSHGSSSASGSLSGNALGISRGRGATTFTISDMNTQDKGIEVPRTVKEDGTSDVDGNSVDTTPDTKGPLRTMGEDESDNAASAVGVQVTVNQHVEYEETSRRR